MSNKMKIPVAEPLLGEEELDLVTETVKSGWISSHGKNISEFENEFARFCGAKYGVSTSSGTAALHLSLASAGIGHGDEVIVPSLTFIATANAVAYTGARPVFVDSEMETWNIDPEKIKERINRRTKAIIPVHLYGHPADMKPILQIARKYGLLVVEDAAEAHGAEYRGKTVGSIGNMACFSFFGNKIITTGEGGMIVTNNKSFAQKARTLRDHGASKRRRYYNPWLGFNYRMTNIQAALGLAQLKKINRILDSKHNIAVMYSKYLNPLVPEIVLHPEADWAKNVYWMYSVLVSKRKKMNRDVLIERLKKKGIDSRPFFFPIHLLSRYTTGERLPVAEFLAASGLNLPSSPNLSSEQIRYVCDSIVEILG